MKQGIVMRPEQGKTLVAIARAAIAEHLDLGATPVAIEAWLRQPSATFVTLHKQGQLRGCIGTLEAYRPLHEDIRHNAIAAAFSDPRFPPVQRHEWPLLEIEVSRLGKPEPLSASDETQAVKMLVPHRDGVILSWAGRRATFLPQVWQQLPDPQRFLTHLKLKAGLPADFWRDDLALYTYEVEHFREPAEVRP